MRSYISYAFYFGKITATVRHCCVLRYIDKVKAETSATKYGVNKVYTDYCEMLDKENLDAVHLCLPHYLHVPVAEYAFSKGVNVISEKPMAISYDSAVNCVDAADKAGVLYGVILQCRYNDASVFVKERIGAKWGKIISARSVLTWNRAKSYYDESDWKGTLEKEGGGVDERDVSVGKVDFSRRRTRGYPRLHQRKVDLCRRPEYEEIINNTAVLGEER